ncbi:MAG: hypothetical protein RIC16_16595 [Rhodospirillales bacterium]
MTRRSALMIFFSALTVRLLYLAIVYDGPGSLMHEDSAMYVNLADWLLMEPSARAAAEIDYSRMMYERAPGYIYFVAAFSWLFEDARLAIVLAQFVLDGFTCVMIGTLAAIIHQRLALLAGLFAALNFNMIINAGFVLSDSLFLLPFVAGMIALLVYLRRPSLAAALGVAALFATALLIRPSLLYFPPVPMLMILIGAWHHRTGPRRAAGHVLVLPIVFALFTGPIFLKNYEDFGHADYTTQTGTHALFWIYPQARELASGIPREQSLREMRARWNDYRASIDNPADGTNPFEQSAEMKRVATAAIRELGFLDLAKAWTIGTIINLSAPAIVVSPPVREMERPSFYETTGADAADKIWNYLAEEPAFSLVILPAALATIVVRLITILGFVQLLPNGFVRGVPLPAPTLTWLPSAALLLIAFYVFAITGPITGAKYRLPVEPVSDIFLAAALIWIADIYRMRRRGAETPSRAT